MTGSYTPRMNVVTGAFGFIGRYIARNLLESGEAVRTVTTHPDKPNPFGAAVQAFPYNFDRPARPRAPSPWAASWGWPWAT